MTSKRKTPTLPQQLRQLADAIEEATQPKRPPTLEESIAAFHHPGELRRRILARRARQAEQEEGDGAEGGDGGAPTAPPQPPQPLPRFLLSATPRGPRPPPPQGPAELARGGNGSTDHG